jgi:pimeloyl-ACP methyl ester carboxylesterase
MAAMPTASSNGIELCYDTFGDPADPTMLLVMGLGSQMIHWYDDLCDEIVGRGFHVVRFDNRDTGESTWLDGVPATVQGALAGGAVDVPYLLADMADDAVGLLDHLGVDRAHVFGVSMGGMIAQTIAIRHPARVASLASVMSTTGDPDVGTPTPEAMAALMAAPPATRQAYQDAAVHHAEVWGSPGLFDVPRLRETAGRAWDRGVNPPGTARQLVAIMSSGSRSVDLAALDVPTVVVHGTADTLVQPTGGERTAEVIPDAKLVVIEGMGHDLAPPLWPQILDAVTGHAAEHA